MRPPPLPAWRKSKDIFDGRDERGGGLDERYLRDVGKRGGWSGCGCDFCGKV